MQYFIWKNIDSAIKKKLLSRSNINIQEAMDRVIPIVQAIAQDGDSALRSYVIELDSANIKDLPLAVTQKEFKSAEEHLSQDIKSAIDFAIANIWKFHLSQKAGLFAQNCVTILPGVEIEERRTAIDSIGLYVPRGRGNFPSMLYMLAIPAIIAGVENIAIATPPLPDGSIDPACLYAAHKIGIHKVYRMGGAQSIAAFAYGTESVASVNKVIGPGNIYVNAAKRVLSDIIDTGLHAGPSESIIIADESANSKYVALDLLIEAEHGRDSSALLITDSKNCAKSVMQIATTYIDSTPEPRQEFLKSVFSQYGGIILCDSIDEAIEIVNQFAPEHLQIQTAQADEVSKKIRNAGEILLGEHSAFSLANYAAGANAVLPTGGRAKTTSAVSLADFTKTTSIIRISKEGYDRLEGHCRTLAKYEQFYSHHNALTERNIDFKG